MRVAGSYRGRFGLAFGVAALLSAPAGADASGEDGLPPIEERPALLASLPAEPAMTRVKLGYDLYFGGQQIAEAEAVLDRSGERYRIAGEVQTVGFVNWLTAYRGETLSAGRIEDGALIPLAHMNWGTWRGRQRETRLDYGQEGLVGLTVVPEPDWSELTPLPDDAARGTLDPLSSIISLALSLEDGRPCEGRFEVFDGRRRYAVEVSPGPPKRLEAPAYSIFTGEAATCAVTGYERIGGFRLDRSKYAETASRKEVYVARPAPDGPPVPVKLEIHTDFGALVVHLTRYATGATQIALPQDS